MKKSIKEILPYIFIVALLLLLLKFIPEPLRYPNYDKNQKILNVDFDRDIDIDKDIDKQQFQIYDGIKKSGIVDMLNIHDVVHNSNGILNNESAQKIMLNYDEYQQKFSVNI